MTEWMDDTEWTQQQQESILSASVFDWHISAVLCKYVLWQNDESQVVESLHRVLDFLHIFSVICLQRSKQAAFVGVADSLFQYVLVSFTLELWLLVRILPQLTRIIAAKLHFVVIVWHQSKMCARALVVCT